MVQKFHAGVSAGRFESKGDSRCHMVDDSLTSSPCAECVGCVGKNGRLSMMLRSHWSISVRQNLRAWMIFERQAVLSNVRMPQRPTVPNRDQRRAWNRPSELHRECQKHKMKKQNEVPGEETTLPWLELEASATLFLTLVWLRVSMLDVSQSAAVFTYTTST